MEIQKGLEAYFNFIPPQKTCIQSKKTNSKPRQNITKTITQTQNLLVDQIKSISWGDQKIFTKGSSI